MRSHKVEERKVGDHYEIWVDGEFYCSCDNLQEVADEEIRALEEGLWEK